MPASKSILIIAGIGSGVGTGGATARAFSKALGYRVALIARNPEKLKATADDIQKAGGEVKDFPVKDYSWSSITSVFSAIASHWPDGEIRATIWNAAQWHKGPFLEVKPADVQESVDVNVTAAFAFAQESVKAFLKAGEKATDSPSRGTLIFTGATAAIRGGAEYGVFAAGKHAQRALSQSLAREFGKQNIHVAHVIVDGLIITDRTKERFSHTGLLDDEHKRLSPEAIANSYLYLHQQDVSAWTHELDLRPAHEKF